MGEPTLAARVERLSVIAGRLERVENRVRWQSGFPIPKEWKDRPDTCDLADIQAIHEAAILLERQQQEIERLKAEQTKYDDMRQGYMDVANARVSKAEQETETAKIARLLMAKDRNFAVERQVALEIQVSEYEASLAALKEALTEAQRIGKHDREMRAHHAERAAEANVQVSELETILNALENN